jgi:hypothetical protein
LLLLRSSGENFGGSGREKSSGGNGGDAAQLRNGGAFKWRGWGDVVGPSIRVRGKAMRSWGVWTAGWGYSKAIRGRDGSANQVQAKKENGTARPRLSASYFLATKMWEWYNTSIIQ